MSRSKTKTTYCGRKFLNKPGYHGQANVCLVINEYPDSRYDGADVICSISDCSRTIELCMDMASAADRANTIYKIGALTDELAKFKKALIATTGRLKERDRIRKLKDKEEDKKAKEKAKAEKAKKKTPSKPK